MKIVSTANLLEAARKASQGKRLKRDVAEFLFSLEDEIFNIQDELGTGSYQPKPYKIFYIYEPKPRRICCSDIRDRVVHHAICNVVGGVFDRRLIADTYACRVDKGTHRAIKKVQVFSRKYPCYLKCDISKFFDSIDHTKLKDLLARLFKDRKLLELLDIIIGHNVPGNGDGKGLPIGNLTSQHFANLYLGELDLFVKNVLRVKGYVRYMDDFILFGPAKNQLRQFEERISKFLWENLRLNMNERVKVVAPVSQGISFLGFRVFPATIRIKRQNLIRLRKKMQVASQLQKYGVISENEHANSVRSMLAHIASADTYNLRLREFCFE